MPPVVFDAVAWVQDIRRASAAGRRVATEARKEFETNGVPIDQLKPQLQADRIDRFAELRY